MPRIDLPDETRADGTVVKHWADLKDPGTLKQRDRKTILLMMDQERGNMAKALDMTAGVLAMLIETWSYGDLAMPSRDINSLDEIPIAAYDVLADAANSAVELIFGAKNLGDPKDPASPSKPSTA